MSTLTLKFTATTGATTPIAVDAEVNGVLYATSTGLTTGSGEIPTLYTYSADGTTGCGGTPITCTPLWTASLAGSNIDNADFTLAVSNGVVYVNGGLGLEAFDAAGQKNCSGSPALCQPLWQASVADANAIPTVSNGTVFVTSNGDVEAFDANDNTNCSGSPKVCSPIWTSAISAPTSAVTVSGGMAYVVSVGVGGTDNTVVALDANGTTGCSGAPKVCTPLWQYQLTDPTAGYVTVQGTTLYAGTFMAVSSKPKLVVVGSVEAFDAKGVSGCTETPTVCSPLWTSPNTFFSGPPVVGDGFAFSRSAPESFAAFDANGQTNCSGTPVVCNPVWTPSIGPIGYATPLAIGGSVLYAAGGENNLYAFDATGKAGCAASVCSPLWSTNNTVGGGVGLNSAVVANGTLYAATQAPSTGNGEVLAYGLP